MSPPARREDRGGTQCTQTGFLNCSLRAALLRAAWWPVHSNSTEIPDSIRLASSEASVSHILGLLQHQSPSRRENSKPHWCWSPSSPWFLGSPSQRPLCSRKRGALRHRVGPRDQQPGCKSLCCLPLCDRRPSLPSLCSRFLLRRYLGIKWLLCVV